MANGKKSLTLRIGWILLVVLGLLITIGGMASLLTAYYGADDPIAGVTLEQLAQVHSELPDAIRGRRATAASLSVAYGIVLIWIATTAYRRGEKWAWFALLTSLGAACLLSLLRFPVLGLRPGTETAIVALAILLVALLVSYRDFR